MRLGISKSKNTINYYIIKDYTKNGKRSTKNIERIGNLEDVKVMAGNQDYKQWLKDYVKKYNEEHCKKEIITIKKNNKKIIESNKNSHFNVGYLFLKSIYNKFDNSKKFYYIIAVMLTCEGLKLGSRMRVDMRLYI